MLFNLSNLNSNLALTLGYLNPALNNLAQASKVSFEKPSGPRYENESVVIWVRGI